MPEVLDVVEVVETGANGAKVGSVFFGGPFSEKGLTSAS